MTRTAAVLIPAFNAAPCIGSAIESALAQSLAPSEIIVIDDASTDNTAEVVAEIGRSHPSVKLIRQAVNGGPGAARNAGIEAATADWIAILDSDDRYLPKRLEYLIGAAEARQLDMAADNFYNYDFHAGRIVGIAIPTAKIGASLEFDRYSFVRNCMTSLAGAVDFGLLKPIMRRKFLHSTGVRYREDVRYGEDFMFYLSALIEGAKFAAFPEGHYVYTQRLGSVSQKHSSLTRTRVDVSAVEGECRKLAVSEAVRNDSKLAELLLLRADRMRAARKFMDFRSAFNEKRFIDAAGQVLLDREVRGCAVAAFQYKLGKRWRGVI
jgi:succinoglycan biosynthesis protein ExoO